MLSKLSYVAVGFVVAVALFASFAVFAQSAPNTIQPTVINIQQDVPVLANIDGAVVPFTVGLSLRVDLSGPVTASVVAAPAPVVEVATATPRSATPSQEDSTLVVGNVAWTLAEAVDGGQTFDYMGELSSSQLKTTEARFAVLWFDVINNGLEPANLDSHIYGYGDYALQLADALGRHFEPYDVGNFRTKGMCRDTGLNPGIGTHCYVVFELPQEVDGLRVEFAGDAAKQAIAIPKLSAE